MQSQNLSQKTWEVRTLSWEKDTTKIKIMDAGDAVTDEEIVS